MQEMATVTTYTAGIAGASGYAGLELQRLLAAHPALAATVLQARSEPYEDIDAERLAGLRHRLPLPAASNTFAPTKATYEAFVHGGQP